MNASLSAAERILKSLAVETPDEIDLEVIAWQMGVTRHQVSQAGRL
ncbi:MAG: hypothetical protein WDN49_25790 [Acetobacteraceae bacterium]